VDPQPLAPGEDDVVGCREQRCRHARPGQLSDCCTHSATSSSRPWIGAGPVARPGGSLGRMEKPRRPPPFDRAEALARLADEQFDVLVVGGGITGAGVALDAASRGLRTALVERDDFASGTSSKSSKLVHGGLRYLNQRDYRLVYEALAERQRLLDNAPHLVKALPF